MHQSKYWHKDLLPQCTDSSTAKLEELIIYICRSREVTLPVLSHILFQIDMLAYLQLGRSITGEEYTKGVDGPMPERFDLIIKQLAAEGTIKLEKFDE